MSNSKIRNVICTQFKRTCYGVLFLGALLLPFSTNAMLGGESEEAKVGSHLKRKMPATVDQEEPSLEGVSETLLIPLYGRALETERPDGIIQDQTAVEVVRRIRSELPALQLSCSPQLQLGLCIRTQILDERVRDFLSVYPDANIINLGAGLCTRFMRLDNGQCHWSELDLPQVENVWHQIYEESANHKFIRGSVTETDWFDKVTQHSNARTLFIAEGLFMYFPEDVVQSIISKIGTHFPGSEILLDVVGIPEWMTSYSEWLFPDLRLSGTKFSWGGNKNTSFEQRDDLSIIGTWPFFERQVTRWSQTTKLTYLYYLPGMGPGPRVIQLKFNER